MPVSFPSPIMEILFKDYLENSPNKATLLLDLIALKDLFKNSPKNLLDPQLASPILDGPLADKSMNSTAILTMTRTKAYI